MSTTSVVALIAGSLGAMYVLNYLITHPHGNKFGQREVNPKPDDFYKDPVWSEMVERDYPPPVHQEHPMQTAHERHSSAHLRKVHQTSEEMGPDTEYVVVDSEENARTLHRSRGSPVVPLSDDYTLGLNAAHIRALHN